MSIVYVCIYVRQKQREEGKGFIGISVSADDIKG